MNKPETLNRVSEQPLTPPDDYPLGSRALVLQKADAERNAEERQDRIVEIIDAISASKYPMSDFIEENFEFADYVSWVLSGKPFESGQPYSGYDRGEELQMIRDRHDKLITEFAEWVIDNPEYAYAHKCLRKLGL